MQQLFQPSERPQPLRILVVEDEASIRAAVSEALRELGVRVVEASSADEAWRFLQSDAGVDLVFTDYRMPGRLTGVDLAQRIEESYPGISVVLTSGSAVPGWPKSPLHKPYDVAGTAARLAASARAARSDGR